jgi:hypothetical protein
MDEHKRKDPEELEREDGPKAPEEPLEDEDDLVDRQADETFPASDPPGNY